MASRCRDGQGYGAHCAMRPCLVAGCPELVEKGRCARHRCQRDAAYNAQPERQRLYGGTWDAYSRARRAAQPWCSLCQRTTDLTVDHVSGMVVCRASHRSEAQGGVRRRRGPIS